MGGTARTRARAVRALLAGGCVLGIGATVTLATWNGTETAGATFAAGTFATQSQGSDGGWAAHPPGSSVPLAVSGPLLPGGTATTKAPGPSQLAWMNVRTTASSSWSGRVAVQGIDAGAALAPVLEYRVAGRGAPSTAACTPADVGAGATWLAGDAATWLRAGDQVSTAAPAVPLGSGGLGLCVEVRLGENASGPQGSALYQGAQGALTLTLAVTGDTPTSP